MPYICLARNDIPDGILQVLDLVPNSSQLNAALSPPGETRYINRVKQSTASVRADGTLETDRVDGLGAYLIDHVEPGGLLVAGGTITVLAGLDVGETVTINGVTFTSVDPAAPPVAASQQFAAVIGVGGSIGNSVTTLAATINDAASRALMEAGTIALSYATASGASPNVTLAAAKAGSALHGWAGSMTLAKAATHMTVSGTRLTRSVETWTPVTLAGGVAALVALVDSGAPLTLAGINAVLTTTVHAELTSTGGSNSRGTVADVLACMAGRTYRIARKSITGAVNQYMDVTYPTFKMNTSSPLGGFQELVYVHGTVMAYGEWKTAAIGGDVVAREVGGIRHSYNIDAISASLLTGQLKSMTGPTELWPSSNVFPSFPWGQSGFTSFDPVAASRLVTVYDDDGTVLV